MHKVAFNQQLKNVNALAISQYVAAGLSLATKVAIIRTLHIADYGIAAIVMAYPALVISFITLDSAKVTLRYIILSRAEGKIDALSGISKFGYCLDFLIVTIGIILTLSSSLWTVRPLVDAHYTLLIIYSLSYLPSALGPTSQAILSGCGRFMWLAIFRIVEPALELVSVLALIHLGFGLQSIVLAAALSRSASGFLVGGVASWTLRVESGRWWWNGRIQSLRGVFRELGSLLGWNYVYSTAQGMLNHLIPIILGHFKGPTDAGIYRLVNTITASVLPLRAGLVMTTYQILGNLLAKKEYDKIIGLLKQWTRREGLVVGVATLGIAGIMSILFRYWADSSYLPAIGPAQILMLSAAISAAFFWLQPWYYLVGHINDWAKMQIVSMAIILLVGIICIMQWGVVGLISVIAVINVLSVLSMTWWAFAKINREIIRNKERYLGQTTKKECI